MNNEHVAQILAALSRTSATGNVPLFTPPPIDLAAARSNVMATTMTAPTGTTGNVPLFYSPAIDLPPTQTNVTAMASTESTESTDTSDDEQPNAMAAADSTTTDATVEPQQPQQSKQKLNPKDLQIWNAIESSYEGKDDVVITPSPDLIVPFNKNAKEGERSRLVSICGFPITDLKVVILYKFFQKVQITGYKSKAAAAIVRTTCALEDQLCFLQGTSRCTGARDARIFHRQQQFYPSD
jgi:hypothetical protein